MADRQIDELSFATSISDATTFAANNNTSTYEAQQVSVGQIATFIGARAEAVHNLGDVYINKSNVATDNPGAIKGWTGEYVTNANNVYPDLYTWVKTTHPELCISKALYDSQIAEFGECRYFVVDEVSGSLRFPKYNYTAPDYPWIYCFNAAVPQTTSQGAAYTEALIGKASVDLSNLSEDGLKRIGNNIRNIGEIVPSALPINSSGLHLLDGSEIAGDGVYANFVSYIRGLYNANPNASYFAQTTDVYNWDVNLLNNAFLNELTGEVSKFGDNSYATTTTIPATANASSFEFVFKVNIYAMTTNQCIIGNSTDTTAGGGFVLRTNAANGRLYCWMTGNSSSWDIFSQFDTGIDLGYGINYVKMSFDGSSYVFSHSYNGTEWVAKSSSTSSTKTANFITNPRLGLSANGYPLQGSLYLDGCYIKVDDAYVWRGKKVTTYNPSQYYNYCVTTYGSCGKFVYDSTNNTVRLPKISNILEGTSDANALGDLVKAGLPNITGRGYDYVGNADTFSANRNSSEGALYAGNSKATAWTVSWNGTTSVTCSALSLDASRSNAIYGNSNTVQPQTIKVLFYIVVATALKTELQLDVDSIMTDLNNKVNTSTLEQVHCIVESWYNGMSYYRLYSDGWCEQGGFFTKTTNPTTVTLFKEMRDDNYVVVLQPTIENSADLYEYQIYAGNKTPTSFGTVAGSYNNNGGNTVTRGCYWEVKGYAVLSY